MAAITTTTVTLHYVEFCQNNLGVWDKKWFGDAKEAQAEYQKMIDEGDFDPELDDGSYGSILEPKTEEVELTPQGLLDFANNFAIDAGSC